MNTKGDWNPYKCKVCGGITMTRHVDDGVTPMYLGCRAMGENPLTGQLKCEGTAVSGMYPNDPVPPSLRRLKVWEWYSPEASEFIKLNPYMRDHVEMGGLLLRGPVDPDWDTWENVEIRSE
jgi:hypothetical protein